MSRFFAMNDPALQVLSQLQDSGKVSIEEDFLSQTEAKTIDQIKDLSEVMYNSFNLIFLFILVLTKSDF